MESLTGSQNLYLTADRDGEKRGDLGATLIMKKELGGNGHVLTIQDFDKPNSVGNDDDGYEHLPNVEINFSADEMNQAEATVFFNEIATIFTSKKTLAQIYQDVESKSKALRESKITAKKTNDSAADSHRELQELFGKL